MSPVKKPIKIAVIDEDAEPVSKSRSRKKSTTSKTKATRITKKARVKKAVSRKSDRAITTEDKKKLVTEAITDIGNNENDVDSFADKLKKELEGAPTVISKRKNELELNNLDASSLSQNQVNQAVDDNSQFDGQSSLNRNEDDEIQEIVKTKARNNRSVSIYKRIAYFFIFLVFVLLTISAYYLLTKVTITLVPDQERMSNNLIFDVQDSDSDRANVSQTSVVGVVKTIKIEYEKSYPASGSKVIGKEAVGKATIVNSYSKNQMLVATTRLVAASGELFRLKNTVNVPAGGEVEVEIYADEPNPDMAIEPTKFSIPGLWAGLQDKIYAKSTKKIVYQQKVKKHITQDDIDNGVRDMRQQLLIKAKTKINESYNKYDEIIYNIDDDSILSSIDAEVGDELDEAIITMSADVIVVAFSTEDSSKLAEKKFVLSLPDNKEVLDFDKENIIYSLNNYNSSEGIATINATFEGKISLKEDSRVIDKEKIVGLNQKQLEVVLEDMDSISGFDIKFYPSFLPEFLKKVPKMPERIEVKIKK